VSIVGRRALMVALAALVLALAPWPMPSAGAQQRRVVVVGDSVILGAQGPMTSAFQGRGWAVTFDAAVNRSTSAGLTAIESHRGELTDSLVVSLGANDAGNTAAFRQRAQAILDATAGVPHVYWVTIREVRDYYAPANQVVRDLAASRPNVTVIDWHAATAGATDLTASDGLHLNGAGANRMAQVVTDAVVAGTLPAAAPAPVAAPAPAPAETVPPAPETTVAPTVPETTLAPTTIAPAPLPSEAPATTTAPSTTEAPPAERTRTLDAERAAADDALVDGGALWTVGGGFAVMVLILAACGVALAVWSLARSGPSAGPPQSPTHPAVRARQRAQRIAAAAAGPEALPDEPPDVVPAGVAPEAHQS
jgi:lysophospholipase L1-like esterase